MAHNPGTLILRSDASTAMGTGHVMRCFALAQAWQDAGGRPIFASAEAAPAMRERLLAANIEIVPLEISVGGEDDARKVEELALHHAASWVVVDGYQFGADYQRQLKAAGLRLLFLDDNGHAGHYSADIVVNQNAHADESLYSHRESYTRLLLGTRFVLLRREFERWRDWSREVALVGRKVLVLMGGSDPCDTTSLTVRSLQRADVEGIEVVIVMGGSNPHLQSVQRLAATFRAATVLRDTSNVSQLMAWADVAFSAAGSTAWELAYMGLPSLLLEVLEHQSPVAKAMAANAAGVNLGWFADIKEEGLARAAGDLLRDNARRKQMMESGRRLVDGKGARRVTRILCGNSGLAESA